MYIIIVGGGETGELLSKILIAEKNDVVVIESDEKRANELADRLDALIIKGDGTDNEILMDSGIEKADALVVLTNDDKVNLMVCQFGKKHNVPKIAARVNDPANKELFNQAGVSAAISTTSAVITSFKNVLSKKGEKSIMMLAGGRAELLEIFIPPESIIVGKKLTDLKLPKGANVALIERSDEVEVPNEDSVVKASDILLVAAHSDVIDDVIKKLVKTNKKKEKKKEEEPKPLAAPEEE